MKDSPNSNHKYICSGSPTNLKKLTFNQFPSAACQGEWSETCGGLNHHNVNILYSHVVPIEQWRCDCQHTGQQGYIILLIQVIVSEYVKWLIACSCKILNFIVSILCLLELRRLPDLKVTSLHSYPSFHLLRGYTMQDSQWHFSLENKNFNFKKGSICTSRHYGNHNMAKCIIQIV